MSTPESIREGEELIAQARRKSGAAIAACIESGTPECRAVATGAGVMHHWLDGAIQARRLFAIAGPDGESYYQARGAAFSQSTQRRLIESPLGDYSLQLCNRILNHLTSLLLT
jgi:hypothetical protein